MNRTILTTFAFGCFAAWSLATAQTTANAASTPSQTDNKASRSTPAAHVAEPSGADPRVCLEHATNLEIHMCAEKYRPRKRRA